MILNADARSIPLMDGSVHMVVTSPPYWGLRDYGLAGQLGLERTPEEYVAALVGVFREVWRVLRADGTCWLNLGDCYATGAGRVGQSPGGGQQGARWRGDVDRVRDDKRGYRGERLVNTNGGDIARPKTEGIGPMTQPNRMPIDGLKPKDLVGIPWRVAFALQADGWYLRSDVIWSKPNPMPESITDRPTKAHEYLFLLAKRERYYYDAEAIREPQSLGTLERFGNGNAQRKVGKAYHAARHAALADELLAGRNRRTVWEIATQPYPEAHFATFPEALVEPCILAGTSERGACVACGAPWERQTEKSYSNWLDGNNNNGRRKGDIPDERKTFASGKRADLHVHTLGWLPTCRCIDLSEGIASVHETVKPLVLDPFAGSGTVGLVCQRLGRRFVGLELKPEYCAMAYKRTAQLGLV